MNARLPTAYPPLPHPGSWSPNIQAAHQTLTDLYQNAFTILHLEDVEPLRIAFHIDSITADAIPILCAMETDGESEHSPPDSRLPEEWLQGGAQVLGELVVALRRMRELARGWFVIPNSILLVLTAY